MRWNRRRYTAAAPLLAMKALSPRSSGFTLIEVIVAIAIVGILSVLAAPSFTSFRQNAELTAFANSVLASMNAARSEAMKRNVNVMLTPLSGADWAAGWKTFVDVDRSGGWTDGDLLITTLDPMVNYTGTGNGVSAGSTPYVLFNGSGYARDTSGSLGNTTISFSRNGLTGAALLAETRRVIIAPTGRVRICKPASTNDANCAAGDNDS